MPKAKKLPSGSWRCQVFDHYEIISLPDGSTKKKRIYKSFTSTDPSRSGKKDCELAASLWMAKRQGKHDCKKLFGQAADEYIKNRESVLSPSTIREYKSLRRNYLSELENIKVDDITQMDIQRCINLCAVGRSPKTVRNIHGLISAVMKTYRPDMALNTALPQRVKPELYIPSDNDIKSILEAVRGTEMELPVMLAAFGPMRRGEIAALRTENITGNIVHVCENMIMDEDGNWIIRHPKSYAGDRYIDFPEFVAKLWDGKDGHVTHLNPTMITDRFIDLLQKIGLPHFRFHDLRHYSASIQHALGIPDAYIMQRGGWGNDGVLKSVYRHALRQKEKEMNQKANDYFANLCNTKCNTKENNPAK